MSAIIVGALVAATHSGKLAGTRCFSEVVILDLAGMGLALPGLVFGIVLALLVVAWLRDGFVTRTVSPVSVSLALVLVILGLIFAASFGPALQARRTAPASLLRVD